MRFLLIPGNNSLSPIAKCLALEHALGARGHTALIAVSRKELFDEVGNGPAMTAFRERMLSDAPPEACLNCPGF